MRVLESQTNQYAVGLIVWRLNVWLVFSPTAFLVGVSYQKVVSNKGNPAHSLALMFGPLSLQVSIA